MKNDHELKGYVDEFYIFNRTLSEGELKQLHDRCKGPLATKILHLNFENTTANLTYDISFQGNDGYLVGFASSGNRFWSYAYKLLQYPRIYFPPFVKIKITITSLETSRSFGGW